MTSTRTLLALGTAVALMGLSTTAFAGPDVAPLNGQQYQVSAQERLGAQAIKRPAPATSQAGAGALIAPSDPHWGPAFDPSVD